MAGTRGGHHARTKAVTVLANPAGNRAERRAAARVARMSPEKAARLPLSAAAQDPGRWVKRGAGSNGKSG